MAMMQRHHNSMKTRSRQSAVKQPKKGKSKNMNLMNLDVYSVPPPEKKEKNFYFVTLSNNILGAMLQSFYNFYHYIFTEKH